MHCLGLVNISNTPPALHHFQFRNFVDVTPTRNHIKTVAWHGGGGFPKKSGCFLEQKISNRVIWVVATQIMFLCSSLPGEDSRFWLIFFNWVEKPPTSYIFIWFLLIDTGFSGNAVFHSCWMQGTKTKNGDLSCFSGRRWSHLQYPFDIEQM